MTSGNEFLAERTRRIAAAEATIARLQGRQLNAADAWLLQNARDTLGATRATVNAMTRRV